MQEAISIKVRRSQLGRVRGSGAAGSGVHHWYAERVTSIALVPLTLWFVFSMVRLAGATQETRRACGPGGRGTRCCCWRWWA